MTASVNNRNYDTEVEDFFAEIDALPSVSTATPSSLDQGHALVLPPPPHIESNGSPAVSIPKEPTTIWEILYDEDTTCPYYWNKETEESVWEVPEAYVRYLAEYDAYKRATDFYAGLEALQACILPPPPPPPPPPMTLRGAGDPHKPSRESIEYLSEYIGYSSSSEENNESTDEEGSPRHKSRRRRGSRGKLAVPSKRVKSNDDHDEQRKSLDPAEGSSPIVYGPQMPDREVGPQLPCDIEGSNEAEEEELHPVRVSDSTTEANSCLFIGPVMPVKTPVTEENKALNDKEEVANHPTLKVSEVNQTIKDGAKLIVEKLCFLDVTESSLSWLQVLLLQLLTRLEDWQLGHLSTEYMACQLAEAELQMTQYEEQAMPDGWTCHWSRDDKRYYYENQITSDTQWDFPTESAAPTNDRSNDVNQKCSVPSIDKETSLEKEDGELEASPDNSPKHSATDDTAEPFPPFPPLPTITEEPTGEAIVQPERPPSPPLSPPKMERPTPPPFSLVAYDNDDDEGEVCPPPMPPISLLLDKDCLSPSQDEKSSSASSSSSSSRSPREIGPSLPPMIGPLGPPLSLLSPDKTSTAPLSDNANDADKIEEENIPVHVDVPPTSPPPTEEPEGHPMDVSDEERIEEAKLVVTETRVSVKKKSKIMSKKKGIVNLVNKWEQVEQDLRKKKGRSSKS